MDNPRPDNMINADRHRATPEQIDSRDDVSRHRVLGGAGVVRSFAVSEGRGAPIDDELEDAAIDGGVLTSDIDPHDLKRPIEASSEAEASPSEFTAMVAGMSDRSQIAARFLYDNAGKAYSPREIMWAVYTMLTNRSKQASFRYFIAQAAQVPFGHYLHSEGATKNRRYWFSASADAVPIIGTVDSDLGGKAATTVLDNGSTDTQTEAMQRTDGNLTRWGLHFSNERTRLAIGGHDIFLTEAQAVAIDHLADGVERTATRLRTEMKDAGTDFEADDVKHLCVKMKRLFATAGMSDHWRDELVTNGHGVVRALQIIHTYEPEPFRITRRR